MTIKKKTINKERTGKITSKPNPKPILPDYRKQLIVQFQDNVQLPYKSDVSKYIKDYYVGPWDKLLKKYPGIEIKPFYSNIDPKTLREWIKKAKEMDPTYEEGNFFSHYKVICPIESKLMDILEDLSNWDNIKIAYKPKKNSKPTVSYSANPDAVTNQTYLNAAPEGIGAKPVWDFVTPVPGSDGVGIKFIDIEEGCTLNHEDLVAKNITSLYGTPLDSGREHGTAVMGIVCASDNTIACVGIAPNLLNADIIAYDPAAGSVASEVLESLKYLNFGDVLLIEATNEGDYGTPCSVPVETTQAEYDAIRLATALGIVVIEPGGNGDGGSTSVNFDDFQFMFQEVLNPSVRDSGAIIVSASHSALCAEAGFENTHKLMPWAPTGERIDCYAWGENIYTLSSDLSGTTNMYTTNFGGTSGAAAIIAGAVINMQAMVFAEHAYKFSPLQIREILRNPNYGTQLVRISGSVNPLSIYMPNLENFVSKHLEFPPDLYLRDFVGDTGEPHMGSISSSPDIILKNALVANSNDAFGEGSGTENSTNLSDTGKINELNYLYFRVLNQGGMDASDVKLNLYYGLPSTLLTPSLLKRIGEFDIPDVPAGEILTVAGPFNWIPDDAEGHYCFVGLVSNPLDPAVNPTTLNDWDWTTFQRFIRENNNITWRNFNIIEVPAPVPAPPAPDPDPLPVIPKKDWKAIEFVSPGLPDQDKKMSLEVISKLPKEAILMLQAPAFWRKEFYRGNPFVRFNKKKRTSLIPIRSRGKTLLSDILFRRNSVTTLKLYINLPDKYFKRNSYLVAVRQMLDGKEIGRVTWELGSLNKKGIRNI